MSLQPYIRLHKPALANKDVGFQGDLITKTKYTEIHNLLSDKKKLAMVKLKTR